MRYGDWLGRQSVVPMRGLPHARDLRQRPVLRLVRMPEELRVRAVHAERWIYERHVQRVSGEYLQIRNVQRLGYL
jgi:hypothetical protein